MQAGRAEPSASEAELEQLSAAARQQQPLLELLQSSEQRLQATNRGRFSGVSRLTDSSHGQEGPGDDFHEVDEIQREIDVFLLFFLLFSGMCEWELQLDNRVGGHLRLPK